jgi:hypothetical protein
MNLHIFISIRLSVSVLSSVIGLFPLTEESLSKVIEFEVLTAAVTKSSIFWDITPCSPLKVNRRFGGTRLLLLQGRVNNPSKKPAETSRAWYLLHVCLFLDLFSRPKEGGSSFLRNVGTYMPNARSHIPEDTLGFTYLISDIINHDEKLNTTPLVPKFQSPGVCK